MHHSYTRSQNVEGLSIYNQQYRSKIGKQEASRSRKHLLGLLSSFTREQEQVRQQQVQELNCYDRMRKLIYKGQVHQQTAKRDLVGAIVIEQKMNQLESRLNRSQPKVSQLTTQTVKQPLFLRRSCIVEDVKKHCLGKFLSHKVNIQAQGIQQQRKAIERDVDKRIDELIQQKQLAFTRIQQEKTALERRLLAKQLEIQALKGREVSLKEHISQLQQQAIGKKDSKRPTVAATNNNNIQQQFHEAFGGMSVAEVRQQLDKAISRCLTMFDRVENRSKENFREETRMYTQKTMTLQTRIAWLERREKQLAGGLKKLEQHQQISDIQANDLLQSKQRLEDLEKVVLAVYTQWYAQRSQAEKKVLRVTGSLSQNYNYAQMLRYMVDHSKNFSTNEKLNDFLFKVLRGVQKIKRVIYPDQCNEKLDALATIDRIEKWIKIKVSQHQRYPKKKTQPDQSEEDYLLAEASL